MTVRPVLLDRGFISAIIDAESPAHAAAAAVYAELLDRYQAQTDRLFALSTVLADIPKTIRNTALAPLLVTCVANQHRSAGADVRVRGIHPEVALTLVMLQRERIRTIATTAHDYDTFDLDVLYAGAPDDEGEPMPDGYVSYRTEPLPARQSTDG